MTFSPKTFAAIGLVAVVGVAVVVARQATANLSPVGVAPAPSAAAPSVAANGVASAVAAAPSARPKKQLLFFMNPNGYPCQTQWGILNNVADSLLKVADVVYIKTTEPADMGKFEAFGIRALPSLVIADETGRELTRFAPGIQSAETVLAALSK